MIVLSRVEQVHYIVFIHAGAMWFLNPPYDISCLSDKRDQTFTTKTLQSNKYCSLIDHSCLLKNTKLIFNFMNNHNFIRVNYFLRAIRLSSILPVQMIGHPTAPAVTFRTRSTPTAWTVIIIVSFTFFSFSESSGACVRDVAM